MLLWGHYRPLHSGLQEITVSYEEGLLVPEVLQSFLLIAACSCYTKISALNRQQTPFPLPIDEFPLVFFSLFFFWCVTFNVTYAPENKGQQKEAWRPSSFTSASLSNSTRPRTETDGKPSANVFNARHSVALEQERNVSTWVSCLHHSWSEPIKPVHTAESFDRGMNAYCNLFPLKTKARRQ